MKNSPRILIVVSIALVFLILFVISKPYQQTFEVNNITSTPTSFWLTPYWLTSTIQPSSTPLSTVIPTSQRPQCIFPLSNIQYPESKPEEYTFSEPQVIFTDPRPINIIEWLPDNQNILLTREIRDDTERYQSIELFNFQTGETLVYGTISPTSHFANPIWVNGLNGVIYPTTEILKFNESSGMRTPPYEMRRQLWISQGNSEQVQTIEDTQLTLDYLSVFSVSVNSNGNQFAYLNNVDKKIFRYSISAGLLERLPSLVFDPTQWDYRQEDSSFSINFKTAWQPNTSNIYLYGYSNNNSYSFLLNTENGQICEMNLFKNDADSWAMTAHWSLNGRYLAIVRTKWKLPISFSDLIILDAFTGNLYEINASQLDPMHSESLNFISDIAWAPDNLHLTVIGMTEEDSNLYIVDFLSMKIAQIPSSQRISRNIGEKSMLWSDDGSQLLVKCPTNYEDKLCLFSFQDNRVE